MSGQVPDLFQTFPEWRAARIAAGGRRPVIDDYLRAIKPAILAAYKSGMSQRKLAAAMKIAVSTSSDNFKRAGLRRVDLGFDVPRLSLPQCLDQDLPPIPAPWPVWKEETGCSSVATYLQEAQPFIMAAYGANYSSRKVGETLQVSLTTLLLHHMSRTDLGFSKFCDRVFITDYPPCPYTWPARPAGQSSKQYYRAIRPWIRAAYAAGLSQNMVSDICKGPSFNSYSIKFGLTRKALGFGPSLAGTKAGVLQQARQWTIREDFLIRRGHHIGTPLRAIMAQLGVTYKVLKARCDDLDIAGPWPEYSPQVMRRRANEYDGLNQAPSGADNFVSAD